jgi:hypothetical protein
VVRPALYACGFAVILMHAERLASLDEGTPVYAQCVELIEKTSRTLR